MTREQLIREMIQIELIYQTRQKLLKESQNIQNTSTLTQKSSKDEFNRIFVKQGKKYYKGEDLYKFITENVGGVITLKDGFKNAVKDFYQKKGLTTTQQDSILNDISKHILGDSTYIISNIQKSYDYCQSLADFPFDIYHYNKDILDQLCKLLNKDSFLKYLNNENSFHSDIYNNISKPDHPMGPGKGEFLTLSLIYDAKSGGFKDHDIIFSDFKGTQTKAEFELKQGQSTINDFRFNTNIKRGSSSSKARAKFIDSLNNFYNSFITYTRQINKLLDVTGLYESEYIKRNFFDSEDKFKDISSELLNYYSTEQDEPKYSEKSQKFKLGSVFALLNSNQKIDIKGVDVLNKPGGGQNLYGEKFQAKNVKDLRNILKDVLNKRPNQNYDDLKNYQIIFGHEDPNDITSSPKVSILYDPNTSAQQNNAYTDMEEFFELFKNKVDAESPFKNITYKTGVSASTLSIWIKNYFDFIIKKYQDLLSFYKNMLVKIKNHISHVNDAVDQTKIQEVLKDFEPKMKTANWDNWKLFLDIYQGLDLGNEEVAIEFKRYDGDGNLVKSKNIVNTISDEFQIIEPNSIPSVDAFFNNAPQDENITLKIKNEDISDEDFEKIMSTKEAFRFLNFVTPNPNPTSNPTVKANNNNKNVLDLLENAINDLIELHNSVYEEYTKGTGNVSAEGILYVRTDSYKEVKEFVKPFYKNSIQYNQLNNMTALTQLASNSTQPASNSTQPTQPASNPNISKSPKIPLIKDIYPNEKILWCNYLTGNASDVSLLTVLLNLKEDLNTTYIKEISNEIIAIKNEITAIKAKTNAKKLSKVSQISDPNLRSQI